MIAGTPDEVLRYWQRKAEHLAAKLDAARRRIERLTAQLADERRYARDLTAQRDGAAETATRLAAELAELRALAETAMRAPTDTERQLAASVVCARLCRPPASPVSAAADALATCRAGANEVDHG